MCYRLHGCQLVVYGKLAGTETKSLSIIELPSMSVVYTQTMDGVSLAQHYNNMNSVFYTVTDEQGIQLTAVGKTNAQSR